MASLPLAMQPHTVTVRRYLGSTGDGPQYGDPVAVRCFVDSKRRMIVAASGQQVTSTATLYTTGHLPADDSRVDPSILFVVGSRVDTPAGMGTVESVSIHDDGGRLAWQHAEIALV